MLEVGRELCAVPREIENINRSDPVGHGCESRRESCFEDSRQCSRRQQRDLRVAQMMDETAEQVKQAQEIAKLFAGKAFKHLPQTTLNALGTHVFALMSACGPEEKEQALSGLAIVLSKVITAQAKERLAQIEGEKIQLAKKRFDELKSKADKVTNEAAAKLGKGKLTPLFRQKA